MFQYGSFDEWISLHILIFGGKIYMKRWKITVTFLFFPPFSASPKPTLLSLMLCRHFERFYAIFFDVHAI